MTETAPQPETTGTVPTDEPPTVSRTKSFLNRHQRPLRVAALCAGAVATFAVGRKSKDVVESVTLEARTPDSDSDQS